MNTSVMSRRVERLEKSARRTAASGDFLRCAVWEEHGGWLLAGLDSDLQASVREKITALKASGPTDFDTFWVAVTEIVWPHRGRRQPFVRRLGSLERLARLQGWLPPAREPTEEELRQMYEDWAEFYFEETGERAPTEEELEVACCTTAEHEA